MMRPGAKMVRRSTAAFLISFNVALGVLVIWFLSRGYQPPPKDAQTLEYKDFVTILLTVLAVMIAVATIMLAAAAVWGFEAIRKEAKASAEIEARSIAAKVAKDIAETVAARTARDTAPSETTSGEADALVEALAAEEARNVR
jgi:hypothetical protein